MLNTGALKCCGLMGQWASYFSENLADDFQLIIDGREMGSHVLTLRRVETPQSREGPSLVPDDLNRAPPTNCLSKLEQGTGIASVKSVP